MNENILDTKYSTEDDKLIVTRSQDVQAILDHAKEKQIGGHNRKSDMRHVMSVPFVIAELWMKECGASIGSHEFAAYAKTKLLSGEYSKLMVHGY
tara:strand:- start:140 stop:424 length:285 start_codon:yes stop_codon:yes gene_type:complete